MDSHCIHLMSLCVQVRLAAHLQLNSEIYVYHSSLGSGWWPLFYCGRCTFFRAIAGSFKAFPAVLHLNRQLLSCFDWFGTLYNCHLFIAMLCLARTSLFCMDVCALLFTDNASSFGCSVTIFRAALVSLCSSLWWWLGIGTHFCAAVVVCPWWLSFT